MIKLVRGVINFHQHVLPGLREQFAQLALQQSPDVLMIACSDSRVVPNLFASTDPGDLFVVRNPGNLVPPAHPFNHHPSEGSEAAAIEMALDRLQVQDIIVCGHSCCAGVEALLCEEAIAPSLQHWIRHGDAARRWLDAGKAFDRSLNRQDQLSQLNVLAQLENLQTYPQVRQGLAAGSLRLHGWWFDLASGNVSAFEPEDNGFVVIDEHEGARILQRIRT